MYKDNKVLIGKNGKIFRFYKFRTMVIDADDIYANPQILQLSYQE